MTQEEKKYNEALERAKKLKETCNSTAVIGWCEYIFPELRESEDERMRKELAALVIWASAYSASGISDVEAKEMLAWIEKQCVQKPIEMKSAEESLGIDSETYNKIVDECIYGEQKPSDMVEPKFHEGDKLVSTKNPRLTYEVLEVGHINEHGNPEYKVEIFTDGKAQNPRNIHDMECCKVDEWAKLIKQNPTEWSEEDERNLQGIIDEIEANKNDAPDYDLATYGRFLSWLKSLKQRIGG